MRTWHADLTRVMGHAAEQRNNKQLDLIGTFRILFQYSLSTLTKLQVTKLKFQIFSTTFQDLREVAITTWGMSGYCRASWRRQTAAPSFLNFFIAICIHLFWKFDFDWKIFAKQDKYFIRVKHNFDAMFSSLTAFISIVAEFFYILGYTGLTHELNSHSYHDCLYNNILLH